VSTLSLGCTNPYVTFPALMGKMPVSGCIDAINILIMKRLEILKNSLDGVALYWHQNFEEFGRQEVTLEGYVEALCARFRGKSIVMFEHSPSCFGIDPPRFLEAKLRARSLDSIWISTGRTPKRWLL